MRDLEEVVIKTLEERRNLVKKHIKEALSSPTENNMKLIKEEAKELCGKYADFFGYGDGYLIGATSTNEDYYWCAISKDLRLRFSSCVSNPNSVSEKMPNNDYSVLDYMIHNDVDGLLSRLRDMFKDCEDVFFTPIYINGKEYNLEL